MTTKNNQLGDKHYPHIFEFSKKYDNIINNNNIEFSFVLLLDKNCSFMYSYINITVI